MMLGTVLLLTAAFSVGDEPPEVPSAHKRWISVYRGIAESVTMRRGDKVLTFVPQPLHFYTNPVRMNDQHGAIFLWTESGRPAVIGSIWSAMNRQNPEVRFVTHEWHSLSVDKNVSATRDDVELWTSGEPGVSWSRLENGPAPAASRPQRLVQMRSLARRYAGEIDVEGESDLRLMDQPLFRYAEQMEGALDGAIFVLAMATDPELLIWLEARQSEGHAAWHVAFARFGNKAMKVKEGDTTVWSCEAGAPGYSDGKYYLRWRAEEMPAAPDTTEGSP
jgi:hypothetical protein